MMAHRKYEDDHIALIAGLCVSHNAARKLFRMSIKGDTPIETMLDRHWLIGYYDGKIALKGGE